MQLHVHECTIQLVAWSKRASGNACRYGSRTIVPLLRNAAEIAMIDHEIDHQLI